MTPAGKYRRVADTGKHTSLTCRFLQWNTQPRSRHAFSTLHRGEWETLWARTRDPAVGFIQTERAAVDHTLSHFSRRPGLSSERSNADILRRSSGANSRR